MKNFYYNHEWPDASHGIPLLIRSRYLQLPGYRRNESFKVCAPYWILDVSLIDSASSWRGGDAASWNLRKMNEVHLIKPYAKFEIRMNVTPITSGLMFFFKNGQLAGLHELYDEYSNILTFIDDHCELTELLKKIAVIGATNAEKQFWEAHSLFFSCLAKIHAKFNLEKERIRKDSFSQNVDHFLKRNLARGITRREIAEHMRVSVSLLSHRYKEETGISPMGRLRALRMELVKNLLSTGMLSLNAIAENTGFCSGAHLSREFRKYAGYSVTEFKANLI